MVPDLTGAAPTAPSCTPSPPDRPGTYLYEAGLAAATPSTRSRWACTAPWSCARPLPGRPTATRRRRSTTRPCWSSARSTRPSTTPPTRRTSTCASTRPGTSWSTARRTRTPTPIPTTAGSDVLLRYVNAGIQYHSMGVLGARQTVIALDGSPLSSSRRYVAETFGPGQTARRHRRRPGRRPATAQAARSTTPACCCTTATSAGVGGMLTSIDVPGTGAPDDTTGPVTSAVA